MPLDLMHSSSVPAMQSNGLLRTALDEFSNTSFSDKAVDLLEQATNKPAAKARHNEILCFNKLTVCSKYFFHAKQSKDQHLMTIMIYLMREIHGRMIRQLKPLTDVSPARLSILESLQSITTDFIHQHDKHLDAFLNTTEYFGQPPTHQSTHTTVQEKAQPPMPTMEPYHNVVDKYHAILKSNRYEKYRPIVDTILFSSPALVDKQDSSSDNLLTTLFNRLQIRSQLGGNYAESTTASESTEYPYDAIVDMVHLIDQQGGASKKGTLTLFYAPWCRYSVPVIPIFKSMMEKSYEFDVKMVNCDTNPDEKAANNVKSYPTIRFKNNHTDSEFNFNDMFTEKTRTLKNLETFATKCSSL